MSNFSNYKTLELRVALKAVGFPETPFIMAEAV